MSTLSTDNLLDLARMRRLAASGRAREIRNSAGLSLAEIAGALGTTVATLQRYEVGERRPSGDLALRWLALLDALDRAGAAAP